MAEKVLNLEIVTPRKVMYSGDVISFSAPGVLGGFQVLFNHAPLLSAIDAGEVKIQEAQGRELRFATSGGFVEVLKNHVSMLAETAERSDEIDKARSESAKERARKRLSQKTPDLDVDRARVALARAMNRLKIAKKA